MTFVDTESWARVATDYFRQGEELMKRFVRLQVALERYGQHDDDCEWITTYWSLRCTCGLQNEIEAAK